MWKLVVGFILFAALALFMLSRGGDIDLGGEKHGSASQRLSPGIQALCLAPMPLGDTHRGRSACANTDASALKLG